MGRDSLARMELVGALGMSLAALEGVHVGISGGDGRPRSKDVEGWGATGG